MSELLQWYGLMVWLFYDVKQMNSQLALNLVETSIPLNYEGLNGVPLKLLISKIWVQKLLFSKI